jgi:hypothetical protein
VHEHFASTAHNIAPAFNLEVAAQFAVPSAATTIITFEFTAGIIVLPFVAVLASLSD